MSHKFCLNLNGSLREFTACIFDFDGVIVDTEKYHYMAWEYAFRSLDCTFSEEEYLPLRSTGRENIIKYIEKKRGNILSENEKNIIIARKQARFKDLVERISEADMVEGIMPFLGKLYKDKILTAIATSSTQAAELMEKFDLNRYFKKFIDSKDIPRKKPFPDIYYKTAEQLKVKPSECLVFEDSAVGVQSALSAGMSVITVGALYDGRALMRITNFNVLLK